MRELWDRARNCWNKILAQEGRSVLVVAHNAVNQALIATAIGTVPLSYHQNIYVFFLTSGYVALLSFNN